MVVLLAYMQSAYRGFRDYDYTYAMRWPRSQGLKLGASGQRSRWMFQDHTKLMPRQQPQK
jgi:hypothetical protein